MNIFKKIYLRAKAFRALEDAIHRADTAYLRYGTRCYVVPNGTGLAIVDRSSFKRFKSREKLHGITTMADVERLCVYYTPRYNGRDPIPPALEKQKRDAYYRTRGLTFDLDF